MSTLTPRAAVAAFHLALIQLLEATGVELELTELSVNVHGGYLRIDIARLTPDGQHIAAWIAGYSIDPRHLATFGTPIPLPGMNGPVQ